MPLWSDQKVEVFTMAPSCRVAVLCRRAWAPSRALTLSPAAQHLPRRASHGAAAEEKHYAVYNRGMKGAVPFSRTAAADSACDACPNLCLALSPPACSSLYRGCLTVVFFVRITMSMMQRMFTCVTDGLVVMYRVVGQMMCARMHVHTHACTHANHGFKRALAMLKVRCPLCSSSSSPTPLRTTTLR
jgi:hypothetical protein